MNARSARGATFRNDRQAHFALADRATHWRGSLGPQRAAHPRPALLRRLGARHLQAAKHAMFYVAWTALMAAMFLYGWSAP